MYLNDGSLIYFKEECSREDFERKVLLYVLPTTNLALPGIRKSIGNDILDFFPARQGVRMNGECLAIAPLPEYESSSSQPASMTGTPSSGKWTSSLRST